MGKTGQAQKGFDSGTAGSGTAGVPPALAGAEYHQSLQVKTNTR